jgi:hypothetical protein
LLAALLAPAVPATGDASAPESSLFPHVRPSAPAALREVRASGSPLAAPVVAVSPRPPSRPEDVIARRVAAAVRLLPLRTGSAPVPDPAERAQVVLAASGAAVRLSPRPEPRPDGIGRARVLRASAVAQRTPAPLVTGKSGPICGDRAIRGETLAPIKGRLQACGVARPVRVTEVAGVPLTQGAIMDCTTAKALKSWVQGSVKPTVGRLGGGVASIRVIASYSCRTRNSRPGAKISEHGKGRAVDISAINLKNGVSLTVLKGWRDQFQGPLLRRMHAGACGPFGTVLGPDADRYHQDHLHLDTARHRSGPYCR